MPDGTTGYPETVLLRLINSEGRPNVKIGASERGAGVGLGGESDPTYVQILAERDEHFLEVDQQRRTRANNQAVGFAGRVPQTVS